MAVKFHIYQNLTSARRFMRRLATEPCVACGTPVSDGPALCDGCAEDLALVRYPCQGCGLPLALPGSRCAACLQRPWHFDDCRVPYVYAAPVDVLVRRMKFDGDLRAACLLGRLMARQLRQHQKTVDCLVPIPLHQRRLITRGYNQSLLLAGELAAVLRIPILPFACLRTRYTLPQTDVDAGGRHRNVRGAFATPKRLSNLRIALVDDVMTSGQTAEAAAMALKRAGAASVSLWACARAGLGMRL